MDRDLGLIHVRLQTWFPLQLQVYVNGHEWLARKLARHGIRYTKQDNAVLWIEDFPRAQTFADRFASLGWVALLDRYARRVNPLLRDVLAPMQYYWVTTQSEYATDLVFKSPQALQELFPRLLTHSTLCFSATDVMSFLGRKFHGKFEGEGVTDQWGQALRGRLPGHRVKHRMKQNWLKMYDEASSVLRVETVINQPEEFRVRQRVHRRGRRRTEWVPLRKRVPPSSALASSPCRVTRGLSTPWPRWTTPPPACGASMPSPRASPRRLDGRPKPSSPWPGPSPNSSRPS